MLKKILILFGGNSPEHDISINSVNFIIENIKDVDYKLVGIDFDGNWFKINKEYVNSDWINNPKEIVNNIIEYLKSFDLVLPIIHGNVGEDGKIQSLFELFNIKYVGSNSYSSLISYDKILTKLILEKYSIPQISYQIYNKNLDFDNIEYPVIVKPAKSGSSIGISIAHNKSELIKSIKTSKKYDKNIIIEKFIENKRELECSIIVNNNKIIVSSIGEIITKEWYDYDSKYNKETKTCISNIDEKIQNEIKLYSKKIFEILGCDKFSRIDFIYDLNMNKLYFNEINTIPGLTNISMFPKLLNNIDITNKEIVDILLNL